MGDDGEMVAVGLVQEPEGGWGSVGRSSPDAQEKECPPERNTFSWPPSVMKLENKYLEAKHVETD